jgi:hypothetical protein
MGMMRLWALVLLVAWVQDDPDSKAKFTPEAEQAERDRRARIEAEVQTLADHPWAGRYYQGDGKGVNQRILLSPKAGFVFTWHGCLGLYDRNFGEVREEKDTLQLKFAFPNSRKGFQGIAGEMVRISWGERRYLVPADEVEEFCNAVNSGDEPRPRAHGNFLLRDKDWEKQVEGKPTLPAAYAGFLLKEPIQAKIVDVGEHKDREGLAGTRFRTTTVTLNVGKKQGVLPGMRFFLMDDSVNDAKVVRVLEEQSIAEMEDLLPEGSEGHPPKVDVEVSTRPRWRR